MDNMTKHTGVLNNTGARIVVVYRTIPDDEEYCLVTSTDALPDKYHDRLMDILKSPEGQAENDLYNVLNRTMFPDGSNALQTLHFKGHLQKQPVSNVTLYPFPGISLPLEAVNAEIDGKAEEYQAAVKDAETSAPEVARTNDSKDPKFVAQGLILQAELLETDALAKREEAYTMAPELRPDESAKKRGRPALTEKEKTTSSERRKEKRRDRDRVRAAKKRLEKTEADIRTAVDNKIVQDAERIV